MLLALVAITWSTFVYRGVISSLMVSLNSSRDTVQNFAHLSAKEQHRLSSLMHLLLVAYPGHINTMVSCFFDLV